MTTSDPLYDSGFRALCSILRKGNLSMAIFVPLINVMVKIGDEAQSVLVAFNWAGKVEQMLYISSCSQHFCVLARCVEFSNPWS
jgi:hypothetical protein